MDGLVIHSVTSEGRIPPGTVTGRTATDLDRTMDHLDVSGNTRFCRGDRNTRLWWLVALCSQGLQEWGATDVPAIIGALRRLSRRRRGGR